jgi:Asp-tRNA(Asn)/Glu-tRNA(Gln) amidotransferase C subunit
MGDVERDSGVSVSHLRMDEPHLDMTKCELFENAPDECGGFFVVPKAVE